MVFFGSAAAVHFFQQKEVYKLHPDSTTTQLTNGTTNAHNQKKEAKKEKSPVTTI
jgi:hypothetical protein